MSVVADRLRAEARDYRTRAIAAGDQGDRESQAAFRVVAVVLNEVAEAVEQVLEEAA